MSNHQQDTEQATALIEELQAAYRQAPTCPGLRRPLPTTRRARPEVRTLRLVGGAVAATALAIGVGYPLIGGSAGSGAPDDGNRVAASAEATPTDSSTASSGATSTATPDDPGVVAEALTAILAAGGSGAEMADLVIDEDASSVTIWLSGEPSSALVAELQEAADAHGVALVIDSAEHSEAELMSIGSALWDRNDEWSTRGFTIDGYWSTAAGLHIWTEGYVDAAREALSSVPEIVEIEDAGGSDAGPGFVETPAPAGRVTHASSSPSPPQGAEEGRPARAQISGRTPCQVPIVGGALPLSTSFGIDRPGAGVSWPRRPRCWWWCAGSW